MSFAPCESDMSFIARTMSGSERVCHGVVKDRSGAAEPTTIVGWLAALCDSVPLASSANSVPFWTDFAAETAKSSKMEELVVLGRIEE